LIEQLLEPRAALTLVSDVAVDPASQVAIGRVEEHEPEGLARDQRVHQVAVETSIDQCARVRRALRVVLDCIGLDLLAPEGVSGFCDRYAFAGAGIEDA